MFKLVKETVSFKDAMDNLSVISSIDLNAPGKIGVIGNSRIVLDEEELSQAEVQWLSGEGPEVLLGVLDSTFRAIHVYLKHLLDSSEMDWEKERDRKAIATMVSLAGEAATRLEGYLTIRLGKPVTGVSESQELRSLQNFYEEKFAKRLKDDSLNEVSDMQLKNLETVRLDQDYELFYIRKEDDSPYFSPELLRHMRLICDVESEGGAFEEDPLLQVHSMLDRDFQATAGQILTHCHPLISDLYKSFKQLSTNQFALMLSSSIMALFLTANPQNLVQNTASKTCQQYFQDFHRLLRAALKTDEYQKYIAYPPEKSDKTAHLLLNLAHSLCYELFHRKGGVKQESIGLIHRTARKGSEQVNATLEKSVSIWNQLSIDDENYRSRLAKFPSGPLFKILDLIRFEGDETPSFDSIAQGNFPMHLFKVHVKDKEIDVLHIPSPTRQSHVNKVRLLDEMRGMLRFYNAESKPRRHLLINLQDRNSWKEFVRCKTVEDMQKNAEYSQSLTVITIAKNSDFYMQNNEYVAMNASDEFMKALLKQLEHAESSGFYFPSVCKTKELIEFADLILPLIHSHFFQKKKTLTRRAREDFIEIFYQFLILRWIDQFKPSSISFSCKDAIDAGSAESALFFAFFKLLSSGFEKRADLDYFRWILYTPALFVRERSIDAERLNRTLTALERMDMSLQENQEAIIEDFAALYSPNFFASLTVKNQ